MMLVFVVLNVTVKTNERDCNRIIYGKCKYKFKSKNEVFGQNQRMFEIEFTLKINIITIYCSECERLHILP